MTEFLNELSENQINYLKQQKKHKYIVGISRILILFSFLFLWEFTANVGIIDSFIFSSPSKIALCFWGMVLDKSIFLHTNVTLYETILSFLLVTATSILVTILLWFSRRLSEILDPYLVVLNSLPKSALAPLLIVWLGATKTTIIVAGMSVAIFGSILNLYTSFMTVDPGKLKLLAAREGLGYLIIYASQVFKMDWLLMSILLLCLMATLLYSLINLLERWCRKHY